MARGGPRTAASRPKTDRPPRPDGATWLRRHGPLLLIVVLAIGLRVAGIQWGLPNAVHYHSYHPDEMLLVGSALRTDPFAGDLDPGFYNYPSLPILLLRVAHDWVSLVAPPGDSRWERIRSMTLTGRAITVLLGAASVFLAFDIGRRLGGRTAGLFAAVLLAIAPSHVASSHYLTVDVPATFWATCSLAAALRLAEGPRVGWALLAGLAAGLAAACKYNAGLVALAPLTAVALRVRPLRSLAGYAALLAAAAGAAFLAGCPGVLLNPVDFVRDFTYELWHIKTGHGLIFEQTPPGWVYHVTHSLRFGLGIPLLALLPLAVADAARRRSAGDLVLAAWALPYFLLIGAAEIKFLRYTVPLLPPLMIWTGALGARWVGSLGLSRGSAACAVLFVGAAFWTAGQAIAYDALFCTQDPRDRAAIWIRENVQTGATVGLAGIPWFWTPPLTPWNGGDKTARGFARSQPEWEYAFRLPVTNVDQLRRSSPVCVILSDLEIRDALRVGKPDVVRLVEALDREYAKETFAPTSAWPGLLGPGYPQEDWLYPAPTIYVYRRR